MRKYLRVEEIRKLLEDALKETLFKTTEDQNAIERNMNNSWNWGATNMRSTALIKMYEALEKEDEDNGTDC